MVVSSIPAGEYVPTADGRIAMFGISWSSFEAIVALRGDSAGPRVTYLDGVLELMSPSKDHERIASWIGRIVEAFAMDRGIELSPFGSWMLKHAPKETGIEPDECYILGGDTSGDRPDLAIEVIWTSGGIDKLEAYRRLGVPEVWFWREGAIEVHVLAGDTYRRADGSVCLPGIDLIRLCAALDRPTMVQAVRAFRGV